MCVCVCVCVTHRGREEGKKGGERDRERDRGLTAAQVECLRELHAHSIGRAEPLPDSDAHRSAEVLDSDRHDVPAQQQRYLGPST